MKIKKVRVKNFRSIEDTGWLPLSIDGVTALVGQNESGKSSILDALALGFGIDPVINKDDFRIDCSYPSILIEADLDDETISQVLDAMDGGWRETLAAFFASTRRQMILRSRVVVTGKRTTRVFDLGREQKQQLAAAIGVPESDLLRTSAPTPDDSPVEGGAVAREEFNYAKFRDELWKAVPDFLLFKEDRCPLPNRIDIEDGKLSDSDGRVGAQNFIDSAEIDIEDLTKADNRRRGVILGRANSRISKQLQEYWSQLLGEDRKISLACELHHYPNDDPEKSGRPYLEFWVREGDQPLYPSQRSRGTRWFIAFFLQLTAELSRYSDSTIFLLDEPAAYLHQSAQKDVVKLIEKLGVQTQIIYSTHSPYMLDQRKLHRVLGVERDASSESPDETVTIVKRGLQLATASELTLAPVLSLMGADLDQQSVIKRDRNVLLEEPSAYYYFLAFDRLLGGDGDLYFVAASGADNIRVLADLFIAWRLGFAVLVDDDQKGKRVIRDIKQKYSMDAEAAKRLQLLAGCEGVEDLFSREAFSKLVVLKEVGGEVSNSKFVDMGKLSKPVLAVNFWRRAELGELTAADVDDETKERFARVFSSLRDVFV